MVYLQYYTKERIEFSEEFKTNLNLKEADMIIRKLIRHFKLKSHNEWKFTKGEASHCVTYKDTGKGYFKFSKKYTSIGVICHELAHAIEINKRGISTHAGRHHNIMARLINYCRKMGYIPYQNKDFLVSIDGKEGQGMSCDSMDLTVRMENLINGTK